MSDAAGRPVPGALVLVTGFNTDLRRAPFARRWGPCAGVPFLPPAPVVSGPDGSWRLLWDLGPGPGFRACLLVVALPPDSLAARSALAAGDTLTVGVPEVPGAFDSVRVDLTLR